jgi:hypothetical protein
MFLPVTVGPKKIHALQFSLLLCFLRAAEPQYFFHVISRRCLRTLLRRGYERHIMRYADVRNRKWPVCDEQRPVRLCVHVWLDHGVYATGVHIWRLL